MSSRNGSKDMTTLEAQHLLEENLIPDINPHCKMSFRQTISADKVDTDPIMTYQVHAKVREMNRKSRVKKKWKKLSAAATAAHKLSQKKVNKFTQPSYPIFK